MTSEDVTLYSPIQASLCWRVGSIRTRIETIPESRRQKAEGSWRVGSIKTRIETIDMRNSECRLRNVN